MKIFGRLFGFITGLAVLLCILITACAFRPDFSREIADFLFPEKRESGALETGGTPSAGDAVAVGYQEDEAEEATDYPEEGEGPEGAESGEAEQEQPDIPCYYCIGYAGESHAWNIIGLEDGWYNVDTIWDDAGGGTYDYFNPTDADYEDSHARQEMSVYLPPCDGQIYRGLEEKAQDDSLRSLEEAGLTADKVFTDMQGYYADCHAQILQNGNGSYTFYNGITGEELLQEWYEACQNRQYREIYMDSAMQEIGAYFCGIRFEVEPLQGGRYLIRHHVRFD